MHKAVFARENKPYKKRGNFEIQMVHPPIRSDLVFIKKKKSYLRRFFCVNRPQVSFGLDGFIAY